MNFLRNLFGTKKEENVTSLSSRDLEKAKKLFLEHECSHYQMGHEGVYNEYKKYRISKEKEKEWRNEFASNWTSRLSVDDMTPVDKLKAAGAYEALPNLFDLAAKGDSYVKLWTADAIWTLAIQKDIDANLKKQAIDTALELLNSIIEGKVPLSEKYKKKISNYPLMIKRLNASTPEEYVVNFAKRIRNQVKKSWWVRLF